MFIIFFGDPPDRIQSRTKEYGSPYEKEMHLQRALLLHRTVEKIARRNSEELRAHLIEIVKRTGFNCIAPLPKDVRFSVETAKTLPKIVKY